MTTSSPSSLSSCSPRTVVVSGASTGIGRATALLLAANGWRVFAGVRRVADAPRAGARVPGSIDALPLDVTDPASVEDARDRVRTELDGVPLTALVNNAGVGLMAPMQTVEPAALQAVWDVNVLGVVRVSQAFLPLMAAGSRLVVLGSVGDRLTVPFGGPLTSSKWAVASLTEAFRLELAARGIAVTLVEPGSIRSDAVAKVERGAADTAERLERTDPALAARFRRAAEVAVANEQHRSDPEVVARAVRRVLDARRPPTRQLVGQHARLLATAAAVLPDRVLDHVRWRMFRQPSGPVTERERAPLGG